MQTVKISRHAESPYAVHCARCGAWLPLHIAWYLLHIQERRIVLPVYCTPIMQFGEKPPSHHGQQVLSPPPLSANVSKMKRGVYDMSELRKKLYRSIFGVL